MSIKEQSSNKVFKGFQKTFTHQSEELGCLMKFAAFIPNHRSGEKLPMLFFLSGLTCTEENFITKSGFHKYAAEHRIIVISPDTSPRGCKIEGDDDSYDFGTGAGFYVDATEEKWKTNYRMYSYITKELLSIVKSYFRDIHSGSVSIMGHSMGGHGALVCALRNPGMFLSVSALAPICNPMQCPWGKKAFAGYLGKDKETWKAYDACELVNKYDGPAIVLFIDQGMDDQFFKDGQLLPDNLVSAAQKNNLPITMRRHEGYDHSYYFIASFIEDHFKFHADYLRR